LFAEFPNPLTWGVNRLQKAELKSTLKIFSRAIRSDKRNIVLYEKPKLKAGQNSICNKLARTCKSLDRRMFCWFNSAIWIQVIKKQQNGDQVAMHTS
jgi:hypothetical protein